jgi:Holliday junction resolvasome RuvABC endonuclease subunit
MQFCERFVTDKTKDVFERAWDLVEHLRAIALNCKPDIVALEGLAFAKNGNATRDLAGLQSAIVTVLRFIDRHEVVIVPPNTVKKTATGKGNASKDEMVDALPLEVRQEFDALGVRKTTGLQDLSDAYWIGKSAEEQQD